MDSDRRIDMNRAAQPGPDTGSNWRAQAQLESRRAATNYSEAKYTPRGERTPAQEVILWRQRKWENRQANISMAHGKVSTSNGSTRFLNGEGRPRPRHGNGR